MAAGQEGVRGVHVPHRCLGSLPRGQYGRYPGSPVPPMTPLCPCPVTPDLPRVSFPDRVIFSSNFKIHICSLQKIRKPQCTVKKKRKTTRIPPVERVAGKSPYSPSRLGPFFPFLFCFSFFSVYDRETAPAATLGLQETARTFGLSLSSGWILSGRGALSPLSLLSI